MKKEKKKENIKKSEQNGENAGYLRVSPKSNGKKCRKSRYFPENY
jgi:hypothetical protein